MGIALLSFSGLFQGISALQRLTATAPARQPQHPARALRIVRPVGTRPEITARPVSSICTPRPAALRVVRVCDSQQSGGDMGRLVISGRMADVCAELDRLAAREAGSTTR
jgi:hypothetical protein